MFLLKLGSRRQLDFELGDEGTQVLGNLNQLAGTTQETLPVHQTLEHFLSHVDCAAWAELRAKMVQRLIRMKALDDGRLQGYLVVAIDATGWLSFDYPHCPLCLTQKQGDHTTYFHLVLEAKLLGPAGLAISLGTEFIEQQPDPKLPADERKQDCELKALARFAPSLKQDFPQTPFCLTGDALYSCGTAIQIAKDHGWQYCFTFKPGRLPTAWDEFQRLLPLAPENARQVITPEGATQAYRWINQLPHQDTQQRTHYVNAIQCLETRDGKTTTFAWATSFSITADNVARLAQKGGRDRWHIENQGFNLQKNSEFNLGHAYSRSPKTLKAYYYLLQIAHLILQFVEQGSPLRRLAQSFGQEPRQLFGSLKNIPRLLRDCFRYRLLPPPVFDLATAAGIQIRLNSS